MRALIIAAVLLAGMALLVLTQCNLTALAVAAQSPEEKARAFAVRVANMTREEIISVGERAPLIFACVEAGGGEECMAGVFQ
jgi:hypothetical protein